MIPWVEIDRALVPGQDSSVVLMKRGQEFSIRTAGTELMNSRRHASEDSLAQLAISRLAQMSGLEILVGGLGMGYTLAAALEHAGQDSRITVSELIPAVVRWNRLYLGCLAGMPLDDPRVRVLEEDVADTIGREQSAWNGILLDVDNGPDGLTREINDRLYSLAGLERSYAALRPGGILAVWSSGPDQDFTRRLTRCGFLAEIRSVRAHKPGKGSRHTVWLAIRSL
ncbi:MAG: hypothetical protein V1793_04930 [Pseudomonadota bacterium]